MNLPTNKDLGLLAYLMQIQENINLKTKTINQLSFLNAVTNDKNSLGFQEVIALLNKDAELTETIIALIEACDTIVSQKIIDQSQNQHEIRGILAKLREDRRLTINLIGCGMKANNLYAVSEHKRYLCILFVKNTLNLLFKKQKYLYKLFNFFKLKK